MNGQRTRTGASAISGVTVVAAIVAVLAFATAAVLFIQGDAAMERLALLFALFGVVVPALIGALRSDQAAVQTNGQLDQRIAEGVQLAMASRRSSDPPIASVDELRARIDNTGPIVPIDMSGPPA